MRLSWISALSLHDTPRQPPDNPDRRLPTPADRTTQATPHGVNRRVGAAPPSIAPYHDRAPVILQPEHFDVWLDPATDPKMFRPLLAPFDGVLNIEPVSKAVNNPRNDSLELLREVRA